MVISRTQPCWYTAELASSNFLRRCYENDRQRSHTIRECAEIKIPLPALTIFKEIAVRNLILALLLRFFL